ncbi:MAG TPA: deoxyribonuclease IV [Haliangiales bacterium]|nr:deoxyribonuclease IV [Haliangiales bacterium]
MRLGAHESISGGLLRAFERADAHRDEAIQIFTQNGSRWAETRRDPGEIREFAAEAARRGVPILAHDSYLINLAAGGELGRKSRRAFLGELERSEALGVRGVVFHPGAHVGAGSAAGMRRVATALRWAIARTPGYRVKVVLELTAGQGTYLGASFEEIRQMLDRVDSPDRTGVCFDTCHAVAAGYDLAGDYEGVWREFDRVLGLGRLVAFHLNDSKRELGSRVDRHAEIGEGHAGHAVFRRLVRDPCFRGIPAVLELPSAVVPRCLERLRAWRGRVKIEHAS